MKDWPRFLLYIIAVATVLVSVFLGWLLKVLVFIRLKALAKRTKTPLDDVVISSLGNVTILWFSVLGLFLSMKLLSLPPQITSIVGRLIIIIIIFSVTVVIANIAGNFIQHPASPIRARLPSATIFKNIIKVIIYVIGILIIFNSLGISVTPLLATLGIGGIAIALALQETLSNVFAGFLILLARQVRVGDYVRLETGDEGHIRDITWRNSVLENPQKNFVVVPNGKLANLLVTNFSLPQKYTVASLTIGVSHDANLDKVESVTMDVCHDVLKEHYKDNDFDIFLRFFAFAESSINFRVSLKVKEITDQYVLIHEIIKSLQKKYREEGIVMPYPIMNVNLSTDKGLSEKQVIETDL